MERVVRLGVLVLVFDLLAGAFFVVTLFDRVVVARGFAVVFAFVAVGFLLVVRVAIKFSVINPVLIIHLGGDYRSNKQGTSEPEEAGGSVCLDDRGGLVIIYLLIPFGKPGKQINLTGTFFGDFPSLQVKESFFIFKVLTNLLSFSVQILFRLFC